MDHKKIIALCMFCFALMPAYGKETALQILRLDQVEGHKLEKKKGFLLIRLQLSSIAPSFNFALIKGTGSKLSFSKNSISKKYVVNLKDKPNGYYVLPLDAGRYQITRVNAPFYNLPYWRDTQNPAWQFTINKERINYIGELNIAGERGSHYISVNLFDRFASNIEEITQVLPFTLAEIPVVNGNGIQDEFDEQWRKAND